MTSGPFDSPDDSFDPGSMSSTSLSITKAMWYRRPWFLASIGIIVVVAISVITDLPHPVTKSEDASQQNGVIKEINGDAAPCIYALHESFGFYQQEFDHTLAASDLATVKNYLLEDQTVCSFASGPVSDMTNNIQVSDTTRGKKIDAALAATVKWITFDAVKTILDIRQYFGSTPFRVNTTSLISHEYALEADRAAVTADVELASNMLGTSLTPIKIPALTFLPLPIGPMAVVQASLQRINTDVAGCVYSLSESASYLRGALARTLAASDLSKVKNELLKDQTACSPANDGVYDLLNNVGFSSTPAGAQMNAAYQETVTWVTVDSESYILAVKNYFGGTSQFATEAAIAKSTQLLDNDVAAETRDLHAASQLLGTALTPITLPALLAQK